MTRLLNTILFCFLTVTSLDAQIYADIAITHGGVSKGTIRVRLDYDKAPRTCANFIGLATGQRSWIDTSSGTIKTNTPYYNGLKLHRLDHDFVIQGGSPDGTSSNGPGYAFQDEFHSDLRHSSRYILSMANSGANSNGSQFFITLRATPILDDKHSVFGEVINDATYPNSRSIIDDFTNETLYPVNGESPTMDIIMESVTISGSSLSGFDVHSPTHLLPTPKYTVSTHSYDKNAATYTISWDRKANTEYYASYTTDLTVWPFQRYHLSMNDSTNEQFALSSIPTARFFAHMVEVDYSLSPRAPADLASAGKQLTLTLGSSETCTLTFDGAGGGTWSHSGGTTGTLSNVVWTDGAPPTGLFTHTASQARHISLGIIQATFDSPMGTEAWHSINLPTSFHTSTTGWTDGSVVADDPASTTGGTTTLLKRVPFTYIP